MSLVTMKKYALFGKVLNFYRLKIYKGDTMIKNKLIRRFIKTVNLIIALIIFNNLANASNSIIFDYASFKTKDSTTTYVEIYYQFANSDLQFIKNDSNYVANVEISAVLYDITGNFVTEISVDQEIFEINYNLTTSTSERNYVIFNLYLKSGRYRLHLLLTDNNTNITTELKENIKVRSFNSNQLALSDIQIATLIEPSAQKSNFTKNGRKIISNPSRIFNSDFLYAEFYFEVYNLSVKAENQSNSFTFSYFVEDENNKIVTDFTKVIDKPGTASAINFPVSINNLHAGKYQVIIEIIDNDTKTKAINNTTFNIIRSPFDLEFADYDKVLDILKAIADRTEITKLKNVSQRNRQQAINEFWKSKDPTPDTPENEFMIEFYNRIAYANTAFPAPGIEGWRTDRGKIFIRYGLPDQISCPFTNYDWERYETWEYYRRNLKFVFIDRYGFGEYPSHWKGGNVILIDVD